MSVGCKVVCWLLPAVASDLPSGWIGCTGAVAQHVLTQAVFDQVRWRLGRGTLSSPPSANQTL